MSKRSWDLQKDELRALRYMQYLYIQHGRVPINPEVFKRLRGLIEGGDNIVAESRDEEVEV